MVSAVVVTVVVAAAVVVTAVVVVVCSVAAAVTGVVSASDNTAAVVTAEVPAGLESFAAPHDASVNIAAIRKALYSLRLIVCLQIFYNIIFADLFYFETTEKLPKNLISRSAQMFSICFSVMPPEDSTSMI